MPFSQSMAGSPTSDHFAADGTPSSYFYNSAGKGYPGYGLFSASDLPLTCSAKYNVPRSNGHLSEGSNNNNNTNNYSGSGPGLSSNSGTTSMSDTDPLMFADNNILPASYWTDTLALPTPPTRMWTSPDSDFSITAALSTPTIIHQGHQHSVKSPLLDASFSLSTSMPPRPVPSAFVNSHDAKSSGVDGYSFAPVSSHAALHQGTGASRSLPDSMHAASAAHSSTTTPTSPDAVLVSTAEDPAEVWRPTFDLDWAAQETQPWSAGPNAPFC